MNTRRPTNRPPALLLGIRADAGKASVPFLRRYLPKAHAILEPALREMSLALVGDRAMSELHHHYLGVSGPTDVLTFELEHDHRGRVTAGEVVVCVPEARRRAREVGGDASRELLLYALHGMLHLCGFDDRTAGGFRRMHLAEDDILKRLGVGAVFAREPRRKRAPATRGDR